MSTSDGKDKTMAVQHYDIDDQWNQKNIEEAMETKKRELEWEKSSGYHAWKAYCNLPEPDDEAVEI